MVGNIKLAHLPPNEQFKVSLAKDNKYKLTVGGFQGTSTDPMAYHNGMYFTTKDSDNDEWSKNCQIDDRAPAGGWWHKQCLRIRPNIIKMQYTSTISGTSLIHRDKDQTTKL